MLCWQESEEESCSSSQSEQTMGAPMSEGLTANNRLQQQQQHDNSGQQSHPPPPPLLDTKPLHLNGACESYNIIPLFQFTLFLMLLCT